MKTKMKPQPFTPDPDAKELAEICDRLAEPLKDFLSHPYVPDSVGDEISNQILEVVNAVCPSLSFSEFAAFHLRTLACQYGEKKGE